MAAILIFESLVIPAIITFMLIALFVINKEFLFFKKSGIKSTNSNKDKNYFPKNDENKFVDFSGGTWGI